MRKINEVLEGIRIGHNDTRSVLAEKMGGGTTKECLDKHWQNDSADAWRIARMCEVYNLPTLPSDWFLNGKTEE